MRAVLTVKLTEEAFGELRNETLGSLFQLMNTKDMKMSFVFRNRDGAKRAENVIRGVDPDCRAEI